MNQFGADTRTPLPIGTTLEGGRFRVERELGRGGFGITYLAMDLALEQPRAVKELYPETAHRQGSRLTFGSAPYDIQRFIREARNAAALRHEGVVTVHSVFEENGTAYLAMEFVDGRSIEDELLAAGKIDPKRAEQCLEYVLRTLDYVHSRNVVHRDIKPSNIISTSANRWVLIDFGSARDSSSHSREVSRMVSASFSPLEQFGGQPPVPASDLFALSATVYQMICGEPPPDAVFRASSGTMVPTLRSRIAAVREPLSSAIQMGLGLRVEERPPTAQAFLRLLSSNPRAESQTVRLESDGFFANPTSVPAPQIWSDPGMAHKKSRKPFVATAAIGVFAVAVIGLLLRDPKISDSAARSTDISSSATESSSDTLAVDTLAVDTLVVDTLLVDVEVDTAGKATAAPVSNDASVQPPADATLVQVREGPDLQLTGYANRPPSCDGSYISLIASAVTPGLYANDVAEKLALYPDASYFYAPGTCRSLRWQLNGNDIYAIYYGPFRSANDACIRARQVGGYVKVLNNTADPSKPYRCG
jgi:serine/threonine protein kinase